MSNLSKEEAKKKKKYHENRVKFYDKKLKDINKEDKRIGFRY